MREDGYLEAQKESKASRVIKEFLKCLYTPQEIIARDWAGRSNTTVPGIKRTPMTPKKKVVMKSKYIIFEYMVAPFFTKFALFEKS